MMPECTQCKYATAKYREAGSEGAPSYLCAECHLMCAKQDSFVPWDPVRETALQAATEALRKYFESPLRAKLAKPIHPYFLFKVR